MNIIDILEKRYSTKSFDSTKKISPEHMQEIKTMLQLSPSSTNLQPWHFIIADTSEGKERVAKGTQGFYKFNERKVLDASLAIVFCSRLQTTEAYIAEVQKQEEQDGRYANAQTKADRKKVISTFSNIHKFDLKDEAHWLDKQVYLAMGLLLLGVAALGIDAVPMEGIDIKAIDEEFELRKKGYSALAIVSLGYRAADDFNAALPKSRFPKEVIFTTA